MLPYDAWSLALDGVEIGYEKVSGLGVNVESFYGQCLFSFPIITVAAVSGNHCFIGIVGPILLHVCSLVRINVIFTTICRVFCH